MKTPPKASHLNNFYTIYSLMMLKEMILTRISHNNISLVKEYVTNYIYLENFDQDMRALEKRFKLKTAPINEFSISWHHQTPAMIYKGNFSEADITDPLFPRYPTFESFMIPNVYNSFKQYFKMISIRINIVKNTYTDFNLLSFAK